MDYAFQLYTARNVPDLGSFLVTLKSHGYAAVEGYESLYGDLEKLAASLMASDLPMPTGHFSLELLEKPERTLEIAHKLGMNHLICPFIGPLARPSDTKGWEKLALSLEKLARLYTHEGLAFSWHNHDFEFVARTGAALPMRVLLENAPSMTWQCDLGWLVRVGEDPGEWLSEFGHHIKSVHIKDLASEDERSQEEGWCAIGSGTLDWPSLLSDVRANTIATSMVVEHDNPTNPHRFAERSITYLRGIEEATHG